MSVFRGEGLNGVKDTRVYSMTPIFIQQVNYMLIILITLIVLIRSSCFMMLWNSFRTYIVSARRVTRST